jgi:putative aldouronate transport system substrate-binding protein
MRRKMWVTVASLLVFAVCLTGQFMGCKKSNSAQSDAGKPAGITVEVYDRGTDGGKSNPADNEWTKWIQEKVLRDENIKVTFVPVNRWDETAVMNNLLSADNAPDVCFSYNGEQINSFGRLGGIADLKPYVEALLPDLKKLLGQDKNGEWEIYRALDTEKNELYTIPNRYMLTATQNMFIRKDWLDKLGLPIPTTKEEFYDALVAFKEKDPGNVGKNKVIPFTLSTDVRWTAGIILDSHIDPYMGDKERWINTVVDRNLLLPGYKEGVRFLNTMYNAGLVDKDFPLYKEESAELNLIKSGVVGSFSHNWDQIYRENQAIMADMQKNVPGSLFVPVDCMKSVDGLTHKRGTDSIAGLSFFVPKTAKNIEAALRYVNWLAKYENYHFLQFGKEGVNHKLVDGIPQVIPATGGWIQNSNANIDYTPSINGYDLQDDDLNVKVLATSYPFPMEDVFEAYRISSFNADVTPFVRATLVEAAPLVQTLTDESAVVLIQSITAPAADFDRVYDAGVEKWRTSGAQKIVDERRAKYN